MKLATFVLFLKMISPEAWHYESVQDILPSITHNLGGALCMEARANNEWVYTCAAFCEVEQIEGWTNEYEAFCCNEVNNDYCGAFPQ